MKPVFILISLDTGAELTVQLIDRTTTLRVVDVEGVESDTLEVTLDDRAGRIQLPETGERIRLLMGYSGARGVISEVGNFVVDEVGLSGPPLTMEISAKGADLVTRDLKAPRTESHHATTIDDLVRKIAAREGLRATVHPKIAALALPHLDQPGESDLAILTRLADLHDLTLKIDAERIVLRPHAARLDGVASAELAIPAGITLAGHQLTQYRWRGKSRTRYSAIRAHYYDPDRAQRVPLVIGDPEAGPTLDLRHDASDAEEAARLAEARLHQMARGTGGIEVVLPGDPRIKAGARLTLTGLRDPLAGEWVVERVESVMDAGGYVTTVTSVPPNDEEDE